MARPWLGAGTYGECMCCLTDENETRALVYPALKGAVLLDHEAGGVACVIGYAP